LNPLGMKGAGESGFTGAAAAIVNAIADALAPFGVEPGGSGPFTPAYVLELLSESANRTGSGNANLTGSGNANLTGSGNANRAGSESANRTGGSP
jgi:carbon-monoxide dehydrogenase large subunit